MTKGQDLSVEEILSSIRGVINSHSAKISQKDLKDDILELTERRYLDDETDIIEELVSESVVEQASEALRDFADHTSKLDPQVLKGGSGKTVEELVVEILRPEIKKWLNINLAPIVRQLVEKEIKRLTPKE